MKSIRTLLIVILTAAVSIIIPLISRYSVALIGSIINGNSFTEDLLLIILFYSIQTGIAVLFVRFILGYSISDMGFNFTNWKMSIKQLKGFIIIWFILDILFYFICVNFIKGFDTYIAYYYVKDTNMFIKDFIKGCLLAGLGEEPLFRGLIVIILSPIIISHINIGKLKLPIVALFSGMLFMLAHIVYEISPFRVVRIDYLELLLTFILGTFWATILIRTKSLLGPILAHSFANTIQIMSGYFVAFFILK